MENKGVKYEFSAKAWHYSSTGGVGGWWIVCLPKEMSKEIRENKKPVQNVSIYIYKLLSFTGDKYLVFWHLTYFIPFLNDGCHYENRVNDHSGRVFHVPHFHFLARVHVLI